jgi:hypothetical protein
VLLYFLEHCLLHSTYSSNYLYIVSVLYPYLKILFSDDFWIGLSYQSKYHGWIWNQNTTSVISSEYTSWTFGQPPTELNDGDCVALTKKSLYLWNVEHCDEKKRYICEKHT